MKRMLIAATLATLLGCAVHADGQTASVSNAVPVAAPRYADTAGHFGVGLVLGEPTGVSLKYFFNDVVAIDGAVGWGFYHETDPYLHSDVLWHKNDLFSVSKGQLSLYGGVGGRVKFRDHADDRFGVRVPVGVSYFFENSPVDVFAEVAPILDFTPVVQGGFSAGMGVRYWF